MSEEPVVKRGRGRPKKIPRRRGAKNLEEMGHAGRPLKTSFFTLTINSNKFIKTLEKEKRLESEIKNLKGAIREIFDDKDYKFLRGKGDFADDDYSGGNHIEVFDCDGAVELQGVSEKLHSHIILYIKHRSILELNREYIVEELKNSLGYNCYINISSYRTLNEDQLKYPFKHSPSKAMLIFPEKHKKPSKKVNK